MSSQIIQSRLLPTLCIKVKPCKAKIGVFASVVANHAAELPVDSLTTRFKDRDRSSYESGGFGIESRRIY